MKDIPKLITTNKVIIVASEYPPLPGGIGNHAHCLADYLCRHNYSVEVITNQRAVESIENQFDHERESTVHRVKRHKFVILTYFYRFIKLWQVSTSYRNAKFIASGKFSLWILGFAPWIEKKNKIAVVHGTELLPQSRIIRYLTSASLKRHKSVIAVSKYTKGLSLQLVPQLSVQVINNGYDDLKFNRFKEKSSIDNNNNSGPNLITVGRVSKRKGQHNVVNAIPSLLTKHPNLQYHIVGIDKGNEELLQQIKTLNLQSHVQFHGMVSDDELFQLLCSSDIFCMLSETDKHGDVEGFGIAIIEANSLGLPAIGSNQTGIVDAIKNEYSGLLVSAQKPEEVSQAILTILDNQATFKKNAKLWSQSFKWSEVVKQYIKLIE